MYLQDCFVSRPISSQPNLAEVELSPLLAALHTVCTPAYWITIDHHNIAYTLRDPHVRAHRRACSRVHEATEVKDLPPAGVESAATRDADSCSYRASFSRYFNLSLEVWSREASSCMCHKKSLPKRCQKCDLVISWHTTSKYLCVTSPTWIRTRFTDDIPAKFRYVSLQMPGRHGQAWAVIA